MKLQLLLFLLSVPVYFCQDLTLEFLKKDLRVQHKLLQASSMKVDSLKSKARAEGRLPNPWVQFGLFPKEIETKNGSTKSKLSLSQVLPPKSQLSLKRKIAFGWVQIEELKREKTYQELLLEIENTFFEYNFLYQKEEVLRENLKLIQSWVKLWETHYAHHNFQYQRLIQLQVDVRELEDDLRSVQELMPVLFSELMTLAWLDQETISKPSFQGQISQQIIPLDLENNIDLLIYESQKRKMSSQIGFAKSLLKPKFKVASEWTMIDSDTQGNQQGDDAWMISLAMELVLDKKKVQHQIKARKLSYRSIDAKKEYLLEKLKTIWKKKSYQLNNSRTQYQLIQEDLLPRTREALDSIQANYITQNKGIDFFSLLGHLRKLLKLSLDMKMHYKDYFQAKAQLKRLSGSNGEN